MIIFLYLQVNYLTFVETSIIKSMEKEQFESCITTTDELIDLIIRLAGNAIIARKVLADTDLERTYNTNTICVDDGEIVEALHDLAMMKVDLDNGLSWVEHLEKNR